MWQVRAFSKIRQPFAAKDFARVGQLAHSWKGTCSYICATQAQRAASRLEQSAKALAAAAGSSDFLAQEVAEALHELRCELQQVAPAVRRAEQWIQEQISLSGST